MIHLFLKRTDSSGFSDEELRAAAQAVRNSMLQSLEETAEPHHTFSESFLRRMRELLRLDQRRNSRRRILQRAAVFLLGVFISGALFLAFNSEARADFIHWVRRVYEDSILYQFFINESETSEANNFNYDFSGLKKEYEVQELFSDDHRKSFLLTNDSNYIILNCWEENNIDYFEVFSNDYTEEYTSVLEQTAIFYRSVDSEIDNVLFWTSPDEKVAYSLYSHLSKEAMIEIAEKIMKN